MRNRGDGNWSLVNHHEIKIMSEFVYGTNLNGDHYYYISSCNNQHVIAIAMETVIVIAIANGQ